MLNCSFHDAIFIQRRIREPFWKAKGTPDLPGDLGLRQTPPLFFAHNKPGSVPLTRTLRIHCIMTWLGLIGSTEDVSCTLSREQEVPLYQLWRTSYCASTTAGFNYRSVPRWTEQWLESCIRISPSRLSALRKWADCREKFKLLVWCKKKENPLLSFVY